MKTKDVLVCIVMRDESRATAAEYLRSIAAAIERGESFESADSMARTMVREGSARWDEEIHFAERYYGVAYDGSEEIRPPAAMFLDEQHALAFANGGTYEDEDDKPMNDGIVFRCDATGLAWNGSDREEPVPYDNSAVRRIR